MGERRAPLAGIRVVDFSRVLSGPIVGRMLCDLGADVIKVEPPEGDLTRYAQPKVNSISLYFTQQNVGKRNVSIDLGTEAGREVARELCELADVVIENFRPGVMERLGLGAQRLRADHPGLVYASISGYGRDNVWSDRRAYAVVVHAEGGLVERGQRMRSQAAGSPQPFAQDGMSHADVYAGMAAATAIVAALFARERNGGFGDHLDVAMADAMLFVQDFAHWDHAPSESMRDDPWPALAPAFSPIVATADDQHVVLAGDPVSAGIFEAYLHAMDRPDIRADARFADLAERRAHRAELLDVIGAWTRTQTAAAIHDRFEAAGIATGTVRAVRDLLDTEWAAQREVLVGVDDRTGRHDTVHVFQTPFRFAEAPVGTSGVAAYRGEHNHEVLRELGYDDDAVTALEAAGVLSSRLPRSG